MTQLSPIGKRLRALQTHKASSLAIAAACKEAATIATGEERARLLTAHRRITNCVISHYVRAVTPKGGATELRIRHPRDCKHPLCQLSSRSKATRMRKKVHEIVAIAQEQEPTAPLLMLVLTARNQRWPELAPMLGHLAESQDRLLKHPLLKRAFLGVISAQEIVCRGTFEAPEAGAHNHLFAMAHPDYFNFDTDKPRYLSQAALTHIFQQCLRVDYKPIVHISRVRAADGSTGQLSIASAISECCKYCISPQEIFFDHLEGLQADPHVIRVLNAALYRRRMIRMTGIFAKASRFRTKQQKEAAD